MDATYNALNLGMLGTLSTRGTARPLARLNVILGCVGLASSCWLWVNPAAAFCVAHTCKNDCSLDAERCIDEGEALYYASPCLKFGVQRSSAQVLGLDDDAFETMVVQAFERWQAVDCGGGQPPSLSVQSVGVVDAAGSFTCTTTLEANLSVWSMPSAWGWSADSVGYTLLRNTLPEGEVVDADVELNAGWFLQTPPEEVTETLLTVATHEAGHVLGMAHSSDPKSIMSAARHRGSDLTSVPLNDDDVAAICTLYPPTGPVTCAQPGYVEGALNAAACAQISAEDPPDSEPKATEPAGGCGVAGRAHPPNGALWGFLGGALGYWRRRRGRPT